ncbi:MAG: hypothetical protein JXB24_12385 [Bacteroidales bacterium]|nr:hypothetical protein [Bacteroidales bacterium]
MLRLIFIISIVISCIRSYGQFTGINHQITKSITYEIANYHLQEFKDLLVYFDIEENDFDFESNLQNDDDLFKFTENFGCGYFTNHTAKIVLTLLLPNRLDLPPPAFL